jgi:hypothetical protein
MNASNAWSSSSDELSARAQRLAHVGAAPELVPKALGVGCPGLRDDALAAHPHDEPADDQRHQELDPDLEGDVVDVVAPRRDVPLA